MVKTNSFRFPSADGVHQIYAAEWIPEVQPRGVVQIIHGISEYVERYDRFARFLAGQGFVVCGGDHLGHGKTAEDGVMGWFAEEKVDWAVVEVGLGGRLDPTNVLQPVCCVITRIGLDHVKVLGDTLEAIAAEKGGIIKENVPVVLQAQEDCVRSVIAKICEEKHATLVDCAEYMPENVVLHEKGATFTAAFPHLRKTDYEISLCGRHQVDNAMTALGAMNCLMDVCCVAKDAVSSGLAAARWPGRLEWFGNILLDGAHNPQGADTVVDYVRKCLAGRRIHVLTGVMADKDAQHVVEKIAAIAQDVVCVEPERMPRAMKAEDLRALYEACTAVPVTAQPDTEPALEELRKKVAETDIILVCGSLYLVGEVRRILTR